MVSRQHKKRILRASSMTAERAEDDEASCLNEKGDGENDKERCASQESWADGSEEKLKPRSRQLGRFN